MIVRNVTFYFEGRPLRGVEDEPIAKALFAAGVRTLSYSVKYKRPRGIHCGRGRCVACHMSVDGVPGVPTCITPLRAGMRVEREDYPPFYGSLAARIAGLVPLPAGFYYRMFTRPALVRRSFMGALRRLAGVGRVSTREESTTLVSHDAVAASVTATSPGARAASVIPAASGDRSTHLIAGSYDVVVVGSGLTGMSAALSSAHRGMNVLLVDEYRFPGGHSFGYQPDCELAAARDEIVDRVKRHLSIDYRAGVTAQGFYPPDVLLLGPGGSTGFGSSAGPPVAASDVRQGNLRRSMTRVRARAFVFATGANDLVPLFENSDLSGIFGERALRLFLERDDFRPGRRAVVYGVGAPLRATAQLLLHHDIKLVALVDPTAGATSDQQRRRILDRVPTFTERKIAAARGHTWVEAVELSRGGAGGRKTVLACDVLCVALPGQPAYELAYQAGFEFALADSPLEENRVMLPVAPVRKSVEDGVSCFVAGGAAGERDWRTKIERGKQTGVDAAEAVRS